MKRYDRLVWTMAAAVCMAAAGPSARAGSVPEAVALAVAQDTVVRSFPGEDWLCWGRAAVEDAQADGETAAWAFFFANPGSGFDSETAVREAILAGMDATDGESPLYVATATVVTGARDTDSLVLRHFRGLPDWWQESVRSGGGAMLLGPGDIRWVGPSGKTGVATRGGKAVAARGAAARKAAKSAAAERAARHESQRQALPAEWRAKAAEGEAEAQAAHRGAWEAKAAALGNAAEGGDR